MSFEPQLANDCGAHEPRHVGRAGAMEAWPELFRDAGASEHRATFEHEGLQPRTRQVGRSGEAIVPRADHHRVEHGAQCIA